MTNLERLYKFLNAVFSFEFIYLRYYLIKFLIVKVMFNQ